MPRIKAVIFDLDDTLYPERDYAFSGFAAVAAAFADTFGDPHKTAARMRTLFDTEHRPKLFNALLAQRGLPEDQKLIAQMIRTYRRHRPTIALYPDADAALTRLRSTYKLGIISDGLMITQSRKLKALRLRDRFDRIIMTGELGPGYEKPHPRAFEWMAECLMLEGRQFVYVADNTAKDFIAPNALGWLTVQIVREHGIYRHEAPAKGSSAGHVIDTLDDLDALVG